MTVVDKKPALKNHYKVLGLNNPSSSPLIWMIHGAGGDLHHYNTVVPTLVNQGYRVLLMDVRYHGRSQLVNDVDAGKTAWTFDDVIDDMDAILKQVKESHYSGSKMNIFLAGLSMGGMISLLYVEAKGQGKDEYPWDKQCIEIKGVILLASAVPKMEIVRPGWELFANREATVEDLENVKIAIQMSSVTPYGQEETKRAMGLISNHALYECLVAIGSLLPNPTSDPPQPYKLVTRLPVLILVPEHDHLTRPELELLQSHNAKEGINSQLIEVAGAGHMVILDKGPVVGDRIVEFVDQALK